MKDYPLDKFLGGKMILGEMDESMVRGWARRLCFQDVLVSSGCSNKISQTARLKRQKFISSLFWKPDVHEGSNHFVSGKISLPGLQMTFLWCMSAGGRRGMSSHASFLIRTLILWDQGPILMTSFNLDDLLIGQIYIHLSKYNHVRG